MNDMGRVAEDMQDGTVCSWCGMYFKYPEHFRNVKKNELPTHGFPVVCESCGRDYTDKQLDELGLQRARYSLL